MSRSREEVISEMVDSGLFSDDEIRNAVKGLGSSTTTSDSSMGDVAMSAVSNAMFQPGTVSRKLASDPIAQAKALPSMAGTVGALAPIPMGAAIGTVAGRQLSNAALYAYGRQEEIPSVGQQVLEGGLAAASDITAIPWVKKNVYGRMIAKTEKAAGVPPPQDIPSLARPTGTQTVSQAIDDAVLNVKTVPKDQANPTFWKQLKDQVDFFYGRERNEVLSKGDQAKLAWLNREIQSGLNRSVPGRGQVAEEMSRALTVPRKIGDAYKLLPRRARIGAEYFGPGAGVGAGAAVLAEYIRRKIRN